MLALQARKADFHAQSIASQTPRLEPPTKDGPYFVMLALAGTEIQPETRIAIPITGTASVGVNLLKEYVRRLLQLVGIKGRK